MSASTLADARPALVPPLIDPAAPLPEQLTLQALGSTWRLSSARTFDAAIRRAVIDRIEGFERIWSRFRTDSLVGRAAASPAGGRFDFGAEGGELFDLYDHLAQVSRGAVDPLIGSDLEALGYDRAYSFRAWPERERSLRRKARGDWSSVRRSGGVLHPDRAVCIDVGAVAKGWLAERVADLLQSAGHAEIVVDASGDLVHRGGAPLAVGLEDPEDGRRVLGVLRIRNAALCASATNRRAWGEGLHHVVDARSGRPAEMVVATWAIASDAAVADGLATALFFTNPADLAPLGAFAFVRRFADGRTDCSSALRPFLFLADEPPPRPGAPA